MGGRDADEWSGRGEVAGNRAIHTVESATHSFSVGTLPQSQSRPIYGIVYVGQECCRVLACMCCLFVVNIYRVMLRHICV
jgi:hypothetical protein